MNEVPLYSRPRWVLISMACSRPSWVCSTGVSVSKVQPYRIGASNLDLVAWGWGVSEIKVVHVDALDRGAEALYKNQHPPRNLQQDYAYSPMVVLGGDGVSYE